MKTKKRVNRHDYPVAITAPGEKGPWYDWLASEDGQKCMDGIPADRHYLENRLWWAFTAGMKVGFQQATGVSNGTAE